MEFLKEVIIKLFHCFVGYYFLSKLCLILFRNNIIQFNDSRYLSSCHYHQDTDPLCPIFLLEDIVSSCGDNYSDVAFQVFFILFYLNF